MEGKSFNAFYDSHLLPILQDLEAIRSKIRKNIFLGGGIGALAGLGIATLAGSYDIVAWAFSVLFPVVIGGGIGLAFSYKAHGRLKKRFKTDVIGAMIGFIDPSLSYDPKGNISPQAYKNSKLFTMGYDRYNGDDHVTGAMGATQIEFSELHTQYETKDKEGKSSWHTIFKGIFFIADFNKNFSGETFVQPDLAEKMFGFLGSSLQGLNKTKGDLVKMENDEFEKEFVVYASDQVEARYILSPKLLQRIIEFRNKTGNKMHLSFIDSKMHIGISLKKNLFEVSYFRSLLNRKAIDEFYRYLDICTGIVEDLDLNTRIWTKA